MTICKECSIDFYGLLEGQACNKFAMLVASSSDIERSVLQVNRGHLFELRMTKARNRINLGARAALSCTANFTSHSVINAAIRSVRYDC
jgi:hypothetical protein